MERLFTLKETAVELGRSYYQVWYACKVLAAIKPLQAQRSRLFRARDVEALRMHFSRKDQE